MRKVLVIEDHTEIRENTCELLELEGFHPIPAINGKEGIEMAVQHSPDIILCDIMMPVSDGYEVFEELKKNTKTASIPFIFLSASVEKKAVEAALLMGVDGYVSKPFHAHELFEEIERCLNLKKGSPS